MGRQLPIAIEVTWQLSSAMLKYEQARREDSVDINNQEIRMGLSMAVIRFINLLTEKFQTKLYAQKIHVIAEELGLPDWLVDVRHEATHGVQPSLPILLTSAKFALHWLKTEYWDRQLCEGSDSESETEDSDLSESEEEVNSLQVKRHFSRLLIDFMQWQHNLQMGSATRKDNKNFQRDFASQVQQLATMNRDDVLEVLMDEGYMLPTREQLEALKISADDLLSSSDLLLPLRLVVMWRPLLEVLRSLGLTPQLLQALAAHPSENTLSQRLTAGWIATILTASKTSAEDAQNCQPILSIYRVYQKCPMQEGQKLLTACLEHPSPFTPRLLPLVFELMKSPLSETKKEQLVHLVQVYTNTGEVAGSGAGADVEEKKLYTLSDLIPQGPEPVVEDMDTAESTELDSNHNITSQVPDSHCQWPLDTRPDWSSIPLGQCLNGAVSFTSLELPPLDVQISLNKSWEECPVASDQRRDEPLEVQESVVEDSSIYFEEELWGREGKRQISSTITIL